MTTVILADPYLVTVRALARQGRQLARRDLAAGRVLAQLACRWLDRLAHEEDERAALALQVEGLCARAVRSCPPSEGR